MNHDHDQTGTKGQSRRTFLERLACATAAMAAPDAGLTASAQPAGQAAPASLLPWYRRALRWGQTNITEMDPASYDIAWWRRYWRDTHIQGVIINAGGIVAYYPSKFPLHHRANGLGARDLYGELARAAHEDGLCVFARMDSNRTHEAFFHAHPDWFAVNRAGQPYREGDLYVTCINIPYYEEYIPGVLSEIIERSHPEGITDNSWSGLDRNSPCYCKNCQRRFRERTGQPIPVRKDWDNPMYRQWILWNYERRLEVWDLNNRTTRRAGGPHCLWVGMNSGSVAAQASRFRDCVAICHRAEILMLDHQARDDASGFQDNGDTGKKIHGLLGWEKLAPESMAMYQAGRPTFRRASKPEPEARLWVLEGIAGGIQPWWHHVGASQEDRRQFRTIEPLNRWHLENQEYLVTCRPLARVGVVWSQRHTDFYGRDDAAVLVDLPYRGMINALIRARIPYLPVHIDHVDRDGGDLAVLVLPDLAVLSDRQCASIGRFVDRGGHLVATGRTSLYDEWGRPRSDYALRDLLGVRAAANRQATIAEDLERARATVHSYLRLSPGTQREKKGSGSGGVPPAKRRHPVLQGLEDTDILAFGGQLVGIAPTNDAEVVLTYIPPFPIYPPETAWMRTSHTDVPGLMVRTTPRGSRVAFLTADLDRRFGRDNLPDHGDLLANLVHWAAGDANPLQVEGRGFIDCHLYHQPGRMILHLVNLTNAATARAPVHELIPVGPLTIRVRLEADVSGRSAKQLVVREPTAIEAAGGWVSFHVSTILDHEVVVIT
ncbi:MAG: alpha-amylase family protein [Isosphaeraceae bacterium]